MFATLVAEQNVTEPLSEVEELRQRVKDLERELAKKQ